MHISLDAALQRQPLLSTVGDKLLPTFPGAAAAYSLRALNGDANNVVNVRRDADDAELDFTAEGVSFELEDWVNGKLEDTLPADVDTAAAAYSLRKVRDAYTGNAVQIRRAFDNVEVNVAFDANDEVSASSAITNISTGYEDLFGVRAYFDGVNDNVVLGSQINMTGDFSLQYSFIVSETNQQIIGRNTTGSYIRAFGNSFITSFRLQTAGGAVNLTLLSSMNYNEAHTIKVKRISGSFGIYDESDVLISDTASNSDTFELDSFGRGRGTYAKGVIWDIRVDTNNDGTIDHSYNGYGNTLSDWEDLVGSNDATVVNGSPELFNGQGFGLDEGDTTATTLGGFLTEGVTIYQPDYSTATGLNYPNNVNLYANQDGIGGKDDALKLEVVSTGTGTVHRAYKSSVDSSGGGTDSVTVSYEIFVPSGSESQEKLGIALEYSSNNKPAADYPSALDTWETVTHTFDGGINTRFYIHVASVGGAGINNAIFTGTTGDHVYIRNLKVEQVKNSATVVTWYDQSVNGYDATQDTAGDQPKIAEAGSLLTNGKGDTVIDCVDTDFFNVSGISLSGGLSIISVLDYDSSDLVQSLYGTDGASISPRLRLSTATDFTTDTNSGSLGNIVNEGSQVCIASFYRNASDSVQMYLNSSTLGSPATVAGDITITRILARNDGATDGLNSGISELIFFNSDQSDNRFKIESNINNYYGIYTPAEDGFVETWYDQSGNGRHALQASTDYQPKIVDAGTYISALDFDGLDDTFSIDVGSSPTTFSMFFVAKVEAFTGSARIFQFGTGNTSTLTLRSDNGDGTYEIEAFIRTSGTNGRYRWDIPANTTGLFSAIFDYSTLSLDLYLNGSLLTRTDSTVPTGTWTVPSGNFLNISGPGVFLNSEFKELTFYASDQSANRSDIEDNINSHYSIYP